MTLDEVCLIIQKTVADYTRRTPPHLKDCDVLTGHIIRALKNASSGGGSQPVDRERRRHRSRPKSGSDGGPIPAVPAKHA
jgi:hypothetical protein